MGKELKITTVKYAKAPDRKAARLLLHKIVEKPASFEPRKVDKQLILYGAARLGKLAKDYFDKLGIPFLFVVDANPDRHRKDPFWTGIDILDINDVPVDMRESALFAICVGTESFTKVRAPLIENGWRDIVPFYDISEAYREFHPLSNGWYSGSLDKSDIFGIESALYRWEDDISRAHHLQFIAWRSLREEWFFDDAPVTINDRYFIPQVLSVLHDHEVFLDIGSYHGEVIIRFLEIVKNRYKEIFAIEPDKENLIKLRSRLKKYMSPDKGNIHLLECSLGSEAKKERFYHGLGFASQFSELGQTEVEVKCLDDLSVPATFIKLHIEGWEDNAISGSLETIRAHRPILTITAYHKRNGLWALPFQVMVCCLDNYAFYFRLHSWHGTGAVIYAIPRERSNC
ncbi:MAG: FkbM family methyltransferase [Candidatus Scalindua sediminis]|nr:FkbM family methyltransferase [Candidatus Scalindua sediminis]